MPSASRIKSLKQRLTGLSTKLEAPDHEPVRQKADSLYQLLEAPRQIFARLCPDLCPTCAEACCQRVSHRGVMDTADLIFLATQGIVSLPQSQRDDNLCPWLGPEGCVLTWNARPFACLHYVCAALKNSMSPTEFEKVQTRLAQAGDARSQLLKLFMNT